MKTAHKRRGRQAVLRRRWTRRTWFALAVVALAVAALAVFGAQAVDSNRGNAERRRAQTAVDAAALAWATAGLQASDRVMPDLRDVQAAIPAYNALADQGYYNIPGRVLIEVFWPPASGPYQCETGGAGDAPTPPLQRQSVPESDCHQYFQVILHSRLDPVLPWSALGFNRGDSQGGGLGSILRGIPGDSLDITVEAVARVAPPRSITADNALVAARQDACLGLIFHGGANIQVSGGNIFSNSTAVSGSKAAGSCHSAITTGRTGSIVVRDGGVRAAGDFQNNAGAAVSPSPEQFAAPQDLQDVPAPDCGSLPQRSQGGSAVPLEPGIYSGITINTGDWTMNPGMYCLNGDFTVSGGSLRGRGVLIMMNGGSIAFSGSANITLSRPNEYVDGKRQHFPGLLIYMPGSNPGGIDLSGSSGSSYAGTVYAPGPRDPLSQEKCTIGGSGTSIRGNVMCSTLGIAENAQVTILYKEEENYRLPRMVELVK